MAEDFKRVVLRRMSRYGDDEEVVEAFVAGMRAVFERQGVVETPLLILRMEDVLANYLLVGRAERISETGPARTANRKEGGTEVAERNTEPHAPGLDEHIGKARERLRKSMKELEESCAKAGTPIDAGLADVMRPILKKAEGVLEGALRDHPRKRRVARKKAVAP